MKVRKAIKKIAALGTGAVMMGATMLGAFGADLANYPRPMFIGDDGTFNGVIVVGDAAAAADIVGGMNVLSALQADAYQKVFTSGATTTIEGDKFLVSASGNDLNLLEWMGSVVSVADSGDLSALTTETFNNNKGAYTYDQYVVMPNARVIYSDDSDASDDPADYLMFNQSYAAWTYRLSFPTAAKSDRDSSNDLDDFDGKEIIMLGKTYEFVNTNWDDTNAVGGGGALIIELMSGAVTSTLAEGTTKTYTIGGKDYEVKADFIGESAVYLIVNGEATSSMATSDTYTLSDGTEIGIKNILYHAFASEIGSKVEFYLGATKLYLKDTSNLDDSAVSAAANGTVKVGSETISDAYVDLIWTNTSTELSLSQIDIVFEPSDDIYIAEGDKLTEEIATDRGETDWVKLHNAIKLDFVYTETLYGETEEIKVAPSGSSKIKLTFTTKSGDRCSEDLFYTDATTVSLRDGNDATKNLTVTEDWAVGDEGLFVIDKSKYTHLLRLKKIDTTNTELDIKDECGASTETITYSGTTATFYKDGQSYDLSGITGGGIVLDDITDDTDSFVNGFAGFWTQHGGLLMIGNDTGVDTFYAGGNSINLEFIEGFGITRDETGTSVDGINITLSITGTKLTPGTVAAGTTVGDSGGAFEISWDSKNDWSTGRTQWGTLVEHDTSGDQDTVTITYNEVEAKPQVYLTTGASTTVSGGDSFTKEIVKIPVTASKLASEVASIVADNMVVIGGPCVNTVAAELMGNPADCTEGFVEGKAMLKLFEPATDKVAMLVAGYSAMDTRRATTVVATYGDYVLSGDEVEVTGTSLTDITVAAPAAETTTTTTVEATTTT